MKRLLRRQLDRLGLDEQAPPDMAGWEAFLERVVHTYTEADRDRYTLERSLMISSREMQELHESLGRSEANFKALVEHSPSGIFVQRDLEIRYMNPAMARLLGYDEQAELPAGVVLEAFIHPDDLDKVRDIRERREQGPAQSDTVRMVRRDGSLIWVVGYNTSIVFDGEHSWLCVVRDVTDQVRAAEELRLSEERYRTLFEGSPLSMMLFDPQSLRILQVNDAAVRLYGYERRELLELRLSDLKVDGADPELRDGMAAVARGERGTWTGVKTHRRRDGSLMELSITSHALTVDGRKANLAVSIDVTGTRRLEEQLRQAQKMDAIGRLAGGIAHDFNNVLAVILGVAELASDQLDDDHAVRRDLREIETAGRRAAMLTEQLLAFGRRQPCLPEVVSLNPIVTNMDRMLCRIIGEDIECTSLLAPRLGSVLVDPGQIGQIILNLVVNARDAMPDGGKLTIETRNVELGDAAAAEAGLAPGRYVELSVTDTGVGMDDATRARIFEPFFTTKGVGKGTGLGLSTVFGIVQQAAGAVEVHSRPGCGASFRIHLPRVDDLPDTMPPESVERHRHSHTETVLLVEDEDSVRRVVGRLLQSHGYSVIEAGSAAAALRALRESDRAVDLVITDLVMPDVDGRTLGERIAREHPGVKMLYMSGYPDHVAMKDRALDVTDHFVSKPFTQEEMHEAVRRALAGDRRPTLAPTGGETRGRTGFPSSAAPASSTKTVPT